MNRTPRSVLSILLTALALAAAAVSLSVLPQAGPGPCLETPVQVAQSTSAILESA